jgi:membrane protein YdbS with pleckstrin-like domain
MKQSEGKSIITTKREREPQPKAYRRHLSGWTIFMVLIIWVILFTMMRTAFHVGSPLVTFFLMVAMLFVALAIFRFGYVRFRNFWAELKFRINKFFKK